MEKRKLKYGITNDSEEIYATIKKVVSAKKNVAKEK